MDAPSSSASEAAFSIEISGVAVETSVVSFSASEWISLPFSVTVAMAAAGEITSFDDVIGSECALTIAGQDILADGGVRYFHGMVRRFESSGVSGRNFLYEAEIVPALYFLSQRRNCRIFQETDVPDIITILLEEAGITAGDYRLALQNAHYQRGFCVQYQETDLEFITRLMEEEGIYYFFEHSKDKQVLVICDDGSVHDPIPGMPSITCNSGGGLVAEKEHVSHFTFSQRQTPQAFAHKNFNFKKPGLDLLAQETEPKQAHCEIYDYPALHTTQARGEALAKVRLEQLVALQKRGHGCSSSGRLTPGYTMSLTDHDSATLNADYLIIEVYHSGSQPQALEERSGDSASYDNRFTVIPAGTQFRPEQKRAKPIVKGLQTAVVVGPPGEEIHTDEHGRVKVQFHWDRYGKGDERSSCWLRVAQAWGGGAWGCQFIPRVGDEVLVDFLEGNPDRPIVTGSVYNADNQPIFHPTRSLTQSGFRTKTHKGEGGNEFRFDDKSGSEEVYIHSERDFTLSAKHNETSDIGNNLYTRVGKTATIDAGEQLRLVCGNASIVLDQSGRIEIRGSELFISGTGTLHLDGRPIQLNLDA